MRYRAITLEEYLDVRLATAAGVEWRAPALPQKVRKVGGRTQAKLRERSGAARVLAIESILAVTEAFAINK